MRLIILIFATALATSCGGEIPPEQKNPCFDEPRASTFMPGISAPGTMGLVTTRIVSGTPAPPDRGDNSWTLEVADSQGAPVTDATVRVKAWMPDHGHGTTPLTHQAAFDGTSYQVPDFNLFMGGYWEFTITVITKDDAVDEAKLGFCVEG